MSNNTISKIAAKATANPEKTLAAAATAVPVVVETVVAVAPVAIVCAAGYGVYRLFKWATEK